MNVRMRHDLKEDGVMIPAGLSYSGYDDLNDDFYLSAEELDGAVMYEDDEDPDSHAFCKVKLSDGRVVYMIGADLDWE